MRDVHHVVKSAAFLVSNLDGPFTFDHHKSFFLAVSAVYPRPNAALKIADLARRFKVSTLTFHETKQTARRKRQKVIRLAETRRGHLRTPKAAATTIAASGYILYKFVS